jgi:hypothetical protein
MDPRSRDEIRPSFASFFTLTRRRAQGRPGARCTRGLVCKQQIENAHEHTGSAEAIRPSLRDGVTAYFALSPVTGFFATVISRMSPPAKLGASIGAPGPHDFAVRFARARQSRTSRPPHLTATFVTIASRPSFGRDAPIKITDLPDGLSEIFGAKDWAGQIRLISFLNFLFWSIDFS